MEDQACIRSEKIPLLQGLAHGAGRASRNYPKLPLRRRLMAATFDLRAFQAFNDSLSSRPLSKRLRARRNKVLEVWTV